jgi:hypothetical protein
MHDSLQLTFGTCVLFTLFMPLAVTLNASYEEEIAAARLNGLMHLRTPGHFAVRVDK